MWYRGVFVNSTRRSFFAPSSIFVGQYDAVSASATSSSFGPAYASFVDRNELYLLDLLDSLPLSVNRCLLQFIQCGKNKCREGHHVSRAPKLYIPRLHYTTLHYNIIQIQQFQKLLPRAWFRARLPRFKILFNCCEPFVSVCVLFLHRLKMKGLAAARFGPPREVVITDLESHLDMCRSNVDRNAASTATVIADNFSCSALQ